MPSASDPADVAKGRLIRKGLQKARCRWCGAPGQTRLCDCALGWQLTLRNNRPYLPGMALHGPLGKLP